MKPGLRKGLSRMMRKYHVRFLWEDELVTVPLYQADWG